MRKARRQGCTTPQSHCDQDQRYARERQRIERADRRKAGLQDSRKRERRAKPASRPYRLNHSVRVRGRNVSRICAPCHANADLARALARRCRTSRLKIPTAREKQRKRAKSGEQRHREAPLTSESAIDLCHQGGIKHERVFRPPKIAPDGARRAPPGPHCCGR